MSVAKLPHAIAALASILCGCKSCRDLEHLTLGPPFSPCCRYQPEESQANLSP